MARLIIFACVALATFNHISTVSSTAIEVIGNGLSNIRSSTQNTLTELMNSVQSEAYTLNKLRDITQVNTLLNNLTTDTADLAIVTLKEAIKSIYDAANIIRNAVVYSSSLLGTLVETLGDILQKVHSLTGQLTSFVAKPLDRLPDQLNTVLSSALSEVGNLEKIVIENLGNVLSTQLINMHTAGRSLINNIQTNILSNISELPQANLAESLSFLGRLFETNHLINSFVQEVLVHIFALIRRFNDASLALTVPIVNTLTTVLNQLTNCTRCLTDD